VKFDKTGRATGDFNALIVGFGRIGQEVLRALVMNGQFEGGHFRAAVFATDLPSVSGEFFADYGTMLKQYDITFHQADARSEAMYRYLQQEGSQLNYVAVCAGDKANREISEELHRYFQRMGREVPIYQCSYGGVLAEHEGKLLKLYDPEVLSMETTDRMAMAVNQVYCGENGKTALENWMDCSYFSRMSSRASADFLPAMLCAAGTTEAEVLQGNWQLTDLQKENLSRTEHLRWCAFHYCMGFSPMDAEEFTLRAAQYRREMEQNGKSSVRVSRDLEKRRHACLVSWDELDELSRKENAATGKNLDYKAMDLENVQNVPASLRIAAGRDR